MAALASSVAVVASTPTKHRNKKRPTSPGNSGGAAAKKKKIGQNIILDTTGENKSLATDSSPGHGELAVKPLIFKDPNFIHSGVGGAGAGKKSRIWKNLKQILATERMLPWKLNDPNYSSIDALPSFKPAKKYSDISGLPIRGEWLLNRVTGDRPIIQTHKASYDLAAERSFHISACFLQTL